MDTEPTRADLEEAVAALRARAQRLPVWHREQQGIADEIDLLVDEWLAAEG